MNNSYTFLSLQKIAAEKDLRQKSILLKALVKQDGVDKKLVLDFLQKQINNSVSRLWVDFCRQVFAWLLKQEKRKEAFEINEEKFFAILESERSPEEKLGLLSALKEHIQYKNSRIIEWIVRESMELSSGYFDLVCDLADYLLAKDIFSAMGEDVQDQSFTDFAVFFRAGFKERIMWLRSCPDRPERKAQLLQWVDNIVLSEANPFVIAEFLKTYPLCMTEEAEDAGRLLDSLPTFLDWPFVQIKMRTLQALAKAAPVMPFSMKVKAIAEKILTGSKDNRLRIQAEYLVTLCQMDDAEVFSVSEEASAAQIDEAVDPEVEIGLIWDEEMKDEPDSFLQGFLTPVGEQTREFVRNTKPALLIVFFLLLSFLLVYFLVGDAGGVADDSVVLLQENLEKIDSFLTFTTACENLSVAVAGEGNPLTEEEFNGLQNLLRQKYERLLPQLSYGQLYLLRIFCGEGAYSTDIVGEQGKRLLLDRIQLMEKQLGLATFFPPSAQAVRVSEPGILTYWRNQPFTVLPDDYSGKLEIRYADGAVFLTADFSEGRADGRLSIFYSDGILLSEENYVQGRLEGDIQLLYQSGIPAYSYSFKAGVCQGQYLSYNRSGEILSTFDCN
jgi:hypothetical protein